MYSEPAVGLYSMGDEVMARAMLYPLSYARTVLRKSGRMDSNQQPMYSNRQSPFCFSSRPNEVVTETFISVDVVPAGSWACTMTIQRGKGSDGVHLIRM